MLIRPEVWERIAQGEVTLQFRRWRRPTVRTGGTLRAGLGVLAIDAVEVVEPASLTAQDARGAGYASLAELHASLDYKLDHEVYRVRLHYAGADPRIALREQADLDAAAFESVCARLDRLDRRPTGAWTSDVLRLIEARPGVRAGDLAASLGLETLRFKTDVRKLKELGLTESLDTGYRLSPRGKAVLDAR